MYNNEMKKFDEATLRLFKSILITDSSNITIDVDTMVTATKKGILFDPKLKFASAMYVDPATALAIKMYGKDVTKISNTFHKDWNTVETISPELHYLQQIIHYITTYGYDSLDIDYDENNAYIPKEKVAIPENVTPFNFTIIKAITVQELTERIQNLLTTGVALSQQQIDDILLIINTCKISVDFNKVNNKEVKTILWLGLKDKPYINVDELLRAMTYVVSSQSLVLRSYRQHQTIKMYLKYNVDKQDKVAKILKDYVDKFGIENIASQFLRNKMLFLAFKCNKTKVLINQIRRKADKYHKPQQDETLCLDDIEKANIWQLIKYYNLCISKLKPTEDKLYQIRNGLNYLKENPNYNLSKPINNIVMEHYSILLKAIETRIEDELSYLKGKILLIPDYIDYKVPTSLKRLIEGIPEGSTITIPDDASFVLGIHWTNIAKTKDDGIDDYWDSDYNKEHRVDLDLHANSVNQSISWYSSFRNNEVLYSGDMTDAPILKGGASEALLFKNPDTTYLITLCDYTQYPEIPYKLVFDFNLKTLSESREHYGNIFTADAKVLNSKITSQGQNTLGLYSNGKFYFTSGSIFNGPVTYKSDLLIRLLKYYKESQENVLTIRELSNIVGFNIISNKQDLKTEDDQEIDYIDLSLENITQDTFVNLFTKPEEGDIVE